MIRTKLYLKITPSESRIVYSGVSFYEFIQYLPHPIENLMTITGGSNIISLETNCERGLELFEGNGLVNSLTEENISDLGNFCFIDYSLPGETSKLSEEQIAELLYLMSAEQI